MMTRRTAMKITSVTLAGIAAGMNPASPLNAFQRTPSARPPLKQRKFVSDVVESTIDSVQNLIGNEELRMLFGNCFPNTLDTTVETGERNGKPDTFVITGTFTQCGYVIRQHRSGRIFLSHLTTNACNV